MHYLFLIAHFFFFLFPLFAFSNPIHDALLGGDPDKAIILVQQKLSLPFYKDLPATTCDTISSWDFLPSHERLEIIDNLKQCHNFKIKYYGQILELLTKIKEGKPDDSIDVLRAHFNIIKRVKEKVFSKITHDGELQIDPKEVSLSLCYDLIHYIKIHQDYYQNKTIIYSILTNHIKHNHGLLLGNELLRSILSYLKNESFKSRPYTVNLILTEKLHRIMNLPHSALKIGGKDVEIDMFDVGFTAANKVIPSIPSKIIATGPKVGHGEMMAALVAFKYELNGYQEVTGGLSPHVKLNARDRNLLTQKGAHSFLSTTETPKIIVIAVNSKIPRVIRTTPSHFKRLSQVTPTTTISQDNSSSSHEEVSYFYDPRDTSTLNEVYEKEIHKVEPSWKRNDPISEEIFKTVLSPYIDKFTHLGTLNLGAMLGPRTLVVKSACNHRAPLSREGFGAGYDGVYNSPEILAHTIFAVCYDFTSRELSPYSNTAGDFWQHTLTVPAHYIMILRPNNSYYLPSDGGGTSAAASILSAVASTLYSHFPTLLFSEIKYALLEGAFYKFKGYSREINGRGMLNYINSFKICLELQNEKSAPSTSLCDA